VVDSQKDQNPRVVGFAMFQQTYSDVTPGIFVHKIFGKHRKKAQKRRVLLALKTTMQ
jgi:hypothetical protein